MSENSNNPINRLVTCTEMLLKRFNEQKGIIDTYKKRKRVEKIQAGSGK